MAPKKKPQNPKGSRTPRRDPWAELAAPFWEALAAAGITTEERDALLIGLLAQWRADLRAKLRQSDRDDENVELAEVFVDLDVSDTPLEVTPDAEDAWQREGALQRLLAEGFTPDRRRARKRAAPELPSESESGHATVVLLGGPGQGKSTVGQFLFLLHAGIILRTAEPSPLTQNDGRSFEQMLEALKRLKLTAPARLRLPVRLELRLLAEPAMSPPMAVAPSLALMSAIGEVWQVPMPDVRVLEKVLRAVPWLLVLDGLDEVPAVAAREALRTMVRAFYGTVRETDGVVLGSSRPQSYDAAFFDGCTEWHLASLSTERARAYGHRLASVWRHDRPADIKRLHDRLDEALKEPSTAALMRSPLQVTIMALLVERMGRAPNRRWALFSEYHRIIRSREIDRDTPFSALIRDHSASLLRIHAHVALCLQAQSEQAQGSVARMSERALAVLIERVLVDDGIPEVEAAKLSGQLLDATEQRLVFLVRQRADAFGFELRSLQEFFAAQAITTGRDEQVDRRMRHLGPIGSWRNAYLFAVSRQFQDSSADVRRDRTVGTCRWIDETSEDEPVMTARVGGQLAVSILADDPFGAQATERMEVVRVALILIELPSHEGQLALVDAVLDRAGDDGRRALVEALRNRFEATERAPIRERLGAWTVLLAALQKGVLELRPLADRNWPSNDEDRRTIAQLAAKRSSAWLWERAFEDRGWMSTRVFRQLLRHQVRLPSDSLEKPSAPERLPALRRVFRHSRGGERRARLSVKNGIFLDYSYSSVEWTKEAAKDLAEWRPEHASWLIWTLLTDFALAPSARSLARALRSLASTKLPREDWLPDAVRLPWVFTLCLDAAEDNAGLVRIADRLELGELGDFHDWRALEGSGVNTRISILAIETLSAHDDPLRLILREGAFVPPGNQRLGWSLSAVRSNREVTLIIQSLISTTVASHTSLAKTLLARLSFALIEDAANRGISLGGIVAPRLLIQIIESMKSPVQLGVLNALDITHWTEEDRWLFFDAMLREEGMWASSGGAGQSTVLFDVALAHFRQAPDALHAKLLARIAWLYSFSPFDLPPIEGLDAPDAHSDDRAILRALGGLREKTVDDGLLSELAALDGWWSLNTTFDVLRMVGTPDGLIDLLAARLITAPNATAMAATFAMERLASSLSQRRSSLLDAETWRQLALPAPHPNALPGRPRYNTPRIRSLKVSNLRAYENFELRAPVGGKDDGQWIVLLGENGAGKTTLLRGLALSLAQPSDAAAIPGRLAEPLLRRGANEGGCVVELTDERSFEARMRVQEAREVVVSLSRGNDHPWVVGYGCHRGSALGSAQPEKARGPFADLANLFDDPPGLVDATAWLRELQRRAHLSPRIWNDVLESATKALTRILLDVQRIELDTEGVFVVFNDKRRFPLRALSDGYLTTAGWAADLMARWIDRCERRKEPVEARFTDTMRGIVLLDDLDLHLHPRWQERVIRDVRDVFPKMSFVATTHNPVTLLGARAGEIFVVADHEGAGKITAIQRDIPPGTRVGQVLTGLWFNRGSEFDFDTQMKLQEHQALLMKGVAEDDPKRLDIERVLRERLGRFMDSSLEGMVASIAAEELRGMTPEPTAAARELARQRIQERVRARRGA